MRCQAMFAGLSVLVKQREALIEPCKSRRSFDIFIIGTVLHFPYIFSRDKNYIDQTRNLSTLVTLRCSVTISRLTENSFHGDNEDKV